jgi:hypothetical protein
MFSILNFLVAKIFIVEFFIVNFSINNNCFGLPFSLAANLISRQTMTLLAMDNKRCPSVFI